MRTGMTVTPALTGIHSFAFALAQSNPSLASPLSAILLNQSVALPTDAYATGETNFGNPVIASVNPLYLTYSSLGSNLSNVCLSDAADPNGDGNKAGEYRYIRLTLPAGLRTISVTRAPATTSATDPDFYLYNNLGQISNGSNTFGISAVANSESAQINVNGGSYVLAVTDYNFTTNTTFSSPCFNVLIN
jgi:hypothetical protein